MTWLRDSNTHLNKSEQDNSKSDQERRVMCELELKNKRDLCVKLKMQKEIMEENAKLMKEVYPNGNHLELLGAAKITQHWIDAIENEEGVKGVFV